MSMHAYYVRCLRRFINTTPLWMHSTVYRLWNWTFQLAVRCSLKFHLSVQVYSTWRCPATTPDWKCSLICIIEFPNYVSPTQRERMCGWATSYGRGFGRLPNWSTLTGYINLHKYNLVLTLRVGLNVICVCLISRRQENNMEVGQCWEPIAWFLSTLTFRNWWLMQPSNGMGTTSSFGHCF